MRGPAPTPHRATLIVAVLAFALALLTAPIPAHSAGVSFGTRAGNTVTYVNDTDTVEQGYIDAFYTGGKTATFTASANALNFSTGTHVTYTRVLVRYGTRFVWVNRYVFDGYNVYLNVPPHSIVTVVGTVAP